MNLSYWSHELRSFNHPILLWPFYAAQWDGSDEAARQFGMIRSDGLWLCKSEVEGLGMGNAWFEAEKGDWFRHNGSGRSVRVASASDFAALYAKSDNEPRSYVQQAISGAEFLRRVRK